MLQGLACLSSLVLVTTVISIPRRWSMESGSISWNMDCSVKPSCSFLPSNWLPLMPRKSRMRAGPGQKDDPGTPMRLPRRGDESADFLAFAQMEVATDFGPWSPLGFCPVMRVRSRIAPSMSLRSRAARRLHGDDDLPPES